LCLVARPTLIAIVRHESALSSHAQMKDDQVSPEKYKCYFVSMKVPMLGKVLLQQESILYCYSLSFRHADPCSELSCLNNKGNESLEVQNASLFVPRCESRRYKATVLTRR
jgi:hypothetical protein